MVLGRIVGRGVPGNPRRKKSHSLIHLRTELLLGYFTAVSCNSSTWRSSSPKTSQVFYPPPSFMYSWNFTKSLKACAQGNSSVQFSHSVVSDSLWHHGLQHTRLSCPSPTPGATQTHVHWVRDAIQPSHPLLSPSPPTFNLSQHQGLFQWISSLHQVAKVLELQLQHHPSSEYSWLISFRIDWFDLLAVQRTPKSLLQNHSSKASILWRWAIFMIQLSHSYRTTGKAIALTRWTFVGKGMSLFLICCLDLS